MLKLKSIIFSRIGPRTDVKKMTRKGLIKSGLIYLIAGIIFFTIYVIVFTASSPTRNLRQDEVSATALLIMIISMLVSMMGIVGGIYLLIRALLRRT